MTVSGVFTELQWIWLLLGTAFVFWEPFSAKLHNYWERSIIPQPAKLAGQPETQEGRDYSENANRTMQLKQTHTWFYGWPIMILYVICMTFTVASLVILATEYSALVNLHHEQTYTLLMAMFVASVILAKLDPLLLHWLVYDGWRYASGAVSFVVFAMSVATVILLGIKDTDPRVAVAAGLFVPFVFYQLVILIIIIVVNVRVNGARSTKTTTA
jgi:hypothetical protein